MTNDEKAGVILFRQFVLRHSFDIRHSSFFSFRLR